MVVLCFCFYAFFFKVYIRGLRQKLGWSDEKIQQVFPVIPEILHLHLAFLRRLRARQGQDHLVTVIGDVLIDQVRFGEFSFFSLTRHNEVPQWPT